jgi:fatty-acyl-CoA synthase
MQATVVGGTPSEVILPVVPMFHANAWGIAFAGPAVGAKLVMPGSKMDGESIHELLETEGVTFSAAVPTVWQMLLQHLDKTGGKLSTLKRVVIGGSACPEAIIRGFHERYGVDVLHAWGMTETSPLGTLGSPNARIAGLSYDERLAYQLKQGRPPLGIDLKLTDDAGARQPHDGRTFGNLKVRGPFVVREYFKGAGGRILDDEGYFDTGDVATIDPEGFMQITDRAKDVIKSGGEWISTIDIENIAMGHPKVALAAVIGVLHPKWDERPLLLIKLNDGAKATKEEMLQFLVGKIAKWWMPDDVAFVDDIPLGATGKIDKKLLRERMKDYVLPATPILAATTVAERAAPDPVLHAPEDASGKSEAPASPSFAGADEPMDAEFEDILPAAAAEAEAPAHDPAPPEPQDRNGEVPPPLPGMPDMTPMGAAAKPAGEAPLSMKASPAKGPAPKKADEAPLFISPMAGQQRRPKVKPKKGWADRYLDLALLVALAPAAMALVGALATRFGLITQAQGFDAMLIQGPTETLGWAPAIALVGVLTGLIGLLVAVFAGFARLWGKAVLALAITLLTWAAVIAFGAMGNRVPGVHDVATDWSEPLMFSPAVLKARGPEANPVDPSPILPIGSKIYAGRSLAEVNAETCPAARPLTVAVPADQAFVHVKSAIEGAGLSIVTADPASGRIEATAVSLFYGFKDDLVVRVRANGAGSRIDLRAVRRQGASDMGANCRRIESLATAITG